MVLQALQADTLSFAAKKIDACLVKARDMEVVHFRLGPINNG